LRKTRIGPTGDTTAGAIIYSRCVDALASVRMNENGGVVDTAFSYGT
jgi:hypothetical protein